MPAGRQGFTMVELLIVIAIMAILSSITVGQFQTAKKKANDVARKSDLNGVSKALQMYFADYGVMPSASADGKIMINPTTAVEWGGAFVDGNYVYMKVVPKENNSSLPSYCYKTDLANKKYALFAQLENTNDKECLGNYSCGNQGRKYCFSYVSPNTTLDIGGSLQ